MHIWMQAFVAPYYICYFAITCPVRIQQYLGFLSNGGIFHYDAGLAADGVPSSP